MSGLSAEGKAHLADGADDSHRESNPHWMNPPWARVLSLQKQKHHIRFKVSSPNVFL